jgi:hypothetical protein
MRNLNSQEDGIHVHTTQHILYRIMKNPTEIKTYSKQIYFHLYSRANIPLSPKNAFGALCQTSEEQESNDSHSLFDEHARFLALAWLVLPDIRSLCQMECSVCILWNWKEMSQPGDPEVAHEPHLHSKGCHCENTGTIPSFAQYSSLSRRWCVFKGVWDSISEAIAVIGECKIFFLRRMVLDGESRN